MAKTQIEKLREEDMKDVIHVMYVLRTMRGGK